MTLRLRNTLLIILASVSAAGPVIILKGIISEWFILNSESLNSIIPAGILYLIVTVSCIFIFISFRNTASFEIFFYYIFLFSFVFDIFKLTDLLVQTHSVWNIWVMLPTRLVYYGRFLGILALVSAGLFATGFEYQRMGITALVCFALPAALVLVLPVDSTSVVPGGTFRIGRFPEIFTAVMILQLIAVINFIIAGIKNESRDYYRIAAGLFAAICGRELTFFFQTPVLQAAGILLILSGTVVFGLRTHRLYLWD